MDKGLNGIKLTLLHINFVLIKLIECNYIWLGELSTQAFVLGMAPKTCNEGIAESGMFI